MSRSSSSEWSFANKYWTAAMPLTHKLGAMWATGQIMHTLGVLNSDEIKKKTMGDFFVVEDDNGTIAHLHSLVELEHALNMWTSI